MPETTRERFDRQVRELGGEPAYEVWQGTHKSHRVICKDGHETFSTPTNVQQGQGICKLCGCKQLDRIAALEAEANFRERVEALGGKCVYIEWLGNRKPHAVICKDGHEGYPRPSNVQQGEGICRKCAGRDPEQAEANFRERVAALGGTCVYAQWLGSKKPHALICAEGHGCNPKPSNVQQGEGICRKCAGNDPEQAEANFRKMVAALGGTCVYTEWLGKDKPHALICAEGHGCNPKPSNVQQGQGICRKCKGMHWDAFYVMRNPRELVVKFGITSGDPRPRILTHKRDGFTELHYINVNFPRAYDLECAVKIGLLDAGFEPVRGREYFRDGALPFILSMLPESTE